MQLRWSHAVVYVRDMDLMLDFYTRVLGFEITDRGPLGPSGGPEIVFLSQVATDHHQLAFLNTRQDDQASNSVNHFAFRVDSLGDVRQMITLLEADGRAENLNPLTHGNAWSIYCNDPEGNGLEVFCDTPWHVQQPQARPWDTALSDEALLNWTRETFEKEPGFADLSDFYQTRKAQLETRKPDA